MARPLRIQFPGALYPVALRGNERRPIFRDDADCQRFLKNLAREYGYRDGSGITRVINRVEAEARNDRMLAAKLERLRQASRIKV